MSEGEGVMAFLGFFGLSCRDKQQVWVVCIGLPVTPIMLLF